MGLQTKGYFPMTISVGDKLPDVTLIKVSAERIQTWGRLGDHVLE